MWDRCLTNIPPYLTTSNDLRLWHIERLSSLWNNANDLNQFQHLASMKFEYEKLAEPDHEIRIAVLQPGSFHDEIVVQFVQRKLKDATPSYQALSYVWGSEDDPSHVNVGSARHLGTVSITANLDCALRHLRNERKPRSLWIDALCINQEDVEEKNVQVMNMGAIFQTADSVIAWLGPERDNSNKAIALLKALGQKVDVDWSTNATSLRTQRGTQKLTRRKERERIDMIDLIAGRGKLPWTLEEIRSLYCIFARPYFERAWIVQEIQLARRVLFRCGFSTLPELGFWRAAHSMRRSVIPFKTITSPAKWFKVKWRIIRLAQLRMTASQVSIYSLRSGFGHLACIDPRDKIYSALGLLDASSRDLQITPTYTQATEVAYREIARRAYTAWSRLDLIDCCELSSKELNIPSWVPDWSTPMKANILSSRWSACAWIATQPMFDKLSLRCTVPGISIGRVMEVEEPFSMDLPTAVDIFSLIRTLRPDVEYLNNVYFAGQSFSEVYCRVLVADQFQYGERAPGSAMPAFIQSLRTLELLWSGNASENILIEEMNTMNSYFRKVCSIFYHRRLFKTLDGYLGPAPAETQIGDVLCILLGCSFPVILRPTVDNTYLLVGPCYAHGLMNGEAIYHNRYAAERGLKTVERGGYPELFDPGDGRTYRSPDEMLEKAGIKIESKKNDPYGLFVLPETLRAAGIPVEDFVLV